MKTSVIAMTAIVAALAACASSDRTSSSAMQEDPTSTSSSTASMSSPGSTYGTSSGSTSTTSSATAQNWSGVVVAVDPILRQDAAAMGVGMAAAAAAGGTLLNEGSPTDKVYRITMRADDGTTQVVVVDSIPTYKSGDRVRYRNGSIQRE
jgi:hypothetical protein